MAVFTTFDDFINSTNGTSVGAGECWDYVNLLWNHLGHRYYTFPPSNPNATNHGIKWGVLNAEARQANIVNHLTYISDRTQLKRGDVVISTDGEFGHGGYLSEDYDPTKVIYGFYTQNYAGRRSVAVDHYSLNDFGGAFRYDGWNGAEPPSPTYKREKHNFPFYLYANKLRSERNM